MNTIRALRFGAPVVVVALAAMGCARDIGTLDGGSAEAFAVNNAGVIVGHAAVRVSEPGMVGSVRFHAFVQVGDGPLRDIHPTGRYLSRATAVNDAGVVVGFSANQALAGVFDSMTPFSWTAAGGFRDLPLPPDADSMRWGRAIDVNENGLILVQSDEPWLLDPGTGTYTKLPTLGRGGQVSALNDKGQVVGSVVVGEGGPIHAAVWDAGTHVVHDLEPGSPERFDAYDINNSGAIVGGVSPAGGGRPSEYRAVGWFTDAHKRQEFGLGVARTVGDNAKVAGTVYDDDWNGTATLWDPVARSSQVLGALGGTKADALAMNDKTMIVGTALSPEGVTRAVVFHE